MQSTCCHNCTSNPNPNHLNALCLTTLVYDIPFCLLNIMSKIRGQYYLGSVEDISIGELTIQDNCSVSDNLTDAIHSFEGNIDRRVTR